MLGWIGWAMVFIGVYLLGEKNIKGFYWMLAAEGFLITDAIAYDHWSLVAASVTFIVLNTINVFKWRKSDGTKVQP